MGDSVTVVILTYNEEIHIRRVIANARRLTENVIIVDSYSTDNTIDIAKELGAHVYQNKFQNQAQQFQWAMDNLDIHTVWLLRLDADEYMSDGLIEEIRLTLSTLDPSISGIVVKRRVFFMGRWMKHGGYYPVKLLRLWRNGHARIEQRWMDEHTFLTQGQAKEFKHDLIDDNLNNLAWWTDKHNSYSTREAIEILSSEIIERNSSEYHEVHAFSSQQAGRKRWYKKNLYLRMPLFFRCFLYYVYRYWIRMGFLDGKRGFIFHFLQAFWYRFLVDAKLFQIKLLSASENKSIQNVIEEKYKIRIN